ncbi:hypothetical protein FHG87_004864 [Trinorchestia longiramus]|nr:hypothetical protein FHG87_004864 [Trinorchestia longiramus]
MPPSSWRDRDHAEEEVWVSLSAFVLAFNSVVDELDYDVLGAGSNNSNSKDEPSIPTPCMSRRPSDTPSICSNRNLRTRSTSRRVSLITGEALEQAHAALALAAQSGETPPPIPTAIVAAATFRTQESQLSLNYDPNSRRPSLTFPPPAPEEMEAKGGDEDKEGGGGKGDEGNGGGGGGGGRGGGGHGDEEKHDARRARRKSTMREESVTGLDVTSPQSQAAGIGNSDSQSAKPWKVSEQNAEKTARILTEPQGDGKKFLLVPGTDTPEDSEGTGGLHPPKIQRSKSEQEWGKLRATLTWYSKLRKIRRYRYYCHHHFLCIATALSFLC